MEPFLFVFVVIAIAVAIALIIWLFRDSTPKPSSAEVLLSERRKALIERCNELKSKSHPREGEIAELDRVLKELDALEQRIKSFAQMHEVINLFSSHADLDSLIRRKAIRSLIYLTISLTLFFITANVAFFITLSAYQETLLWFRLVQLAQESKVAVFMATFPLIYSLVLALVFMRFHHKTEEDLAPYLSERVKWAMIYKVLVAAEMVGATEPTENLVLETFLQLRGMAFGFQEQEKTSSSKSVDEKDREGLGTPADAVSKALQSLAGVRHIQS